MVDLRVQRAVDSLDPRDHLGKIVPHMRAQARDIGLDSVLLVGKGGIEGIDFRGKIAGEGVFKGLNFRRDIVLERGLTVAHLGKIVQDMRAQQRDVRDNMRL